MKKTLICLLFYFVSINSYASEIKFEKIVKGLSNPWSLSFINEEKIIFTEKSGKLNTLNLKNKATRELAKIDNELTKKIDGAYEVIENSKKDSIKKISNQILEITKLALSKVSSMPINDKEIKDSVTKAQSTKSVH